MLTLIAERIPITVSLAALSILIAYLLAIPLGILSAVRPYTVGDRITSTGLFLLYSLPSFFIGTILLQALSVGNPWELFPNSGWRSEGASALNTWDQLRDVLWHVTLPLVVMTYGSLAALSRYARTGMLDVIRSDFVRTARAKGLSETAVVLRHAARNGMMPVVTLLGGVLPGLIGGSIIVEYIFNIQGMGLLVFEAINGRDYNIVMGETLIIAALTLVGILLSDVMYALLDPRISLQATAADDLAPTRPAQVTTSYWSVVWAQLQKNRIAMFALGCVRVFLLLAIFAPVLAFNVPLVMKASSAWSAPMLDRLFDRFVFPEGWTSSST